MKVKELIEMLKKSNPEDHVVIATEVGGYMGQKPFVSIVHLYNGFDWDHGYTYIIGNQDLYTQKQRMDKKLLLK